MIKRHEVVQGDNYTIGFTKGKDIGFEITYDKNNRNIIKDVSFTVGKVIEVPGLLQTRVKITDASINDFNDFAKRAIKYLVFKSGINYELISHSSLQKLLSEDHSCECGEDY